MRPLRDFLDKQRKRKKDSEIEIDRIKCGKDVSIVSTREYIRIDLKNSMTKQDGLIIA